MGKRLQRIGRVGRWAERLVALPGTLGDLKAWSGWGRAAWGVVSVTAAPAVVSLRSWIVENFLNVVVVAGGFAVSGYALYRVCKPGGAPKRFRALAPRIWEALDTWYTEEPWLYGKSLMLISRLVPHLEDLGIPCPPKPGDSDEARAWFAYAEDLLPLAELGKLERARRLLRQIGLRAARHPCTIGQRKSGAAGSRTRSRGSQIRA